MTTHEYNIDPFLFHFYWINIINLIYQFISFDVFQLNIYELISLQAGSFRAKQKLCLEIRSATSGSEEERLPCNIDETFK